MYLNVRVLLADAARRLATAGVESPRVDAELLLAHATGRSRSGLLVLDEVDGSAADRFAALVDQRADRVPVQHLTGRAAFRYLELAVGPGVFVPRPETEQIVEWCLGRLAGLTEPVVVDLGTGSGAIALSIAHEHPGARVTAVERDPDAIEWTRVNAAARVAAGDRPVQVLAGDMTDPRLLPDLDGRVDLVVSNPPYVPDGAGLPREVADHDPPLALWGGPDGLDVVRGLLTTAARLRRPGGALGIEHADQQGTALPALVRAHGGWDDVADHPDLAGRPRFTTAQRVGHHSAT
jgi:release factor glutamine methyltransferase